LDFKKGTKLLNFITAGESHGIGLAGIIEGVPAGLEIDKHYINAHLNRRQAGYGRSSRMNSADKVEIISGIYQGKTIGSPIAIIIRNDPENQWYHDQDSLENDTLEPVTVPRPGHADLSGYLKYRFGDIRPVMERASARETTMRVALGSIARKFLETLNVIITSHVIRIGHVVLPEIIHCIITKKNIMDISSMADTSPVRCLDEQTTNQMILEIDTAKQNDDTLGGVFEILADGLIPGLGDYTSWNKRINADLAKYISSIPGIKGIEFGDGFQTTGQYGSEVNDQISYENNKGFARNTNHAGGIEGGITNGQRLIIRAAMKPVPTLTKQQKSVDVLSKEIVDAPVYRADICAVPAAGIIAESMTALCLMNAYLDKLGGDSMKEILQRYEQTIM
jgi:chorismate synthase